MDKGWDREGLEKWIDDLKDKLGQWVVVNLFGARIWWERWIQIVSKGLKNNLQPWMIISLDFNNLWYTWVEILANEWKDDLKEWMDIYLGSNGIWDIWVKTVAETWKDSLKPEMFISLDNNKICLW